MNLIPVHFMKILRKKKIKKIQAFKIERFDEDISVSFIFSNLNKITTISMLGEGIVLNTYLPGGKMQALKFNEDWTEKFWEIFNEYSQSVKSAVDGVCVSKSTT